MTASFWEGDTSWMVLADVAKIVLIYLVLRFVLRRLVDRVLWPVWRKARSGWTRPRRPASRRWRAWSTARSATS